MRTWLGCVLARALAVVVVVVKERRKEKQGRPGQLLISRGLGRVWG